MFWSNTDMILMETVDNIKELMKIALLQIDDCEKDKDSKYETEHLERDIINFLEDH